jgi:K+-sensing histidine kinase KdpD
MGLGLPLSRRLIELQGGQLDIASHIGAGTRVTLRFPLRADIDHPITETAHHDVIRREAVPREAVGWAE